MSNDIYKIRKLLNTKNGTFTYYSLTELETYVSTEDLFDAIQEIFPGDYSPAIISQGMQQYGFKFTLLPSDRPQFVWLIKRR